MMDVPNLVVLVSHKDPGSEESMVVDYSDETVTSLLPFCWLNSQQRQNSLLKVDF